MEENCHYHRLGLPKWNLLKELKDMLSNTFKNKQVSMWGIPINMASSDTTETAKSDVILLKFLKAKNSRVQDSYNMLIKCLKWRKAYGADSIVEQDLGFKTLKNRPIVIPICTLSISNVWEHKTIKRFMFITSIFRYISLENIPQQYGGIYRTDNLKTVPVSEIMVKVGEKFIIKIEGIRAHAKVWWDVVAGGSYFEYSCKFIPDEEASLVKMLQNPVKKKAGVCYCYTAQEPGKIVISIHNRALLKTKLVSYRYKVQQLKDCYNGYKHIELHKSRKSPGVEVYNNLEHDESANWKEPAEIYQKRLQVVERRIKMLTFKPRGVNSIVLVVDYESQLTTELSIVGCEIYSILRDKYPGMISYKPNYISQNNFNSNKHESLSLNNLQIYLRSITTTKTEFMVKYAFKMLNDCLEWRQACGADSITEQDLGLKQLEDVVSYIKDFDRGDRPKRLQVVERRIKMLTFKPRGVNSIVLVVDYESHLTTELSIVGCEIYSILRDKYPGMISYKCKLFRLLTHYILKIVSFNVGVRYIRLKYTPIHYGGFGEHSYLNNGPTIPVSAITFNCGEKITTFQLRAHTIITWDVVVRGWDIECSAYFLPDDVARLARMLENPKNMEVTDLAVRRHYTTKEPSFIH
ncbi:hypothetical protein CTI12_AA494230 [Artemisia annua]|uniref:CRAL-TRIO domain-containing protein n=1 Tax=Artemisia annua TaxID=35608 RepID=A0A2U1LG46_ARTAN|nr:hypothetical protein CTI12_AA494230 [Artemisia annua]